MKKEYVKNGVFAIIGIGCLFGIFELLDDRDDYSNYKSQEINNLESVSILPLSQLTNIVASDLDVLSNELSCDSDYNNYALEYTVSCVYDNLNYVYKISGNTQEIISMNHTDVSNSNDTEILVMLEQDAKNYALKHAGLLSSDVAFIKVDLDYDDGVSYYDIEFKTDAKFYEYEINSKTGVILKYSIESIVLNDSNANNSNVAYIGEQKAKSIALAHAGVLANDIIYTKFELDYDNGIFEYDIEFVSGIIEYEYCINAITGDILEFDVDYDG